MKKIIAISLALGILAMAFIFLPSAPENSNVFFTPVPSDTDFIVGAMGNGDERDYQNKSALNINLWHRYTGNTRGWTGIPADSVWADPVNYENDVSWRINQNMQNGLFTFYDRPK